PRGEPRARPRLVAWAVEHEISVEEDVERLARRDGDRGRHVEPPPEDLEGHARQFLAQGPRRDLPRRRRREYAGLLGLAQLRTSADGRQHHRLPEHALPVRVDPALRTGLPGEILQGQTREPKTPAIGEDEPRPRDEQAVLARRDLVV